MTYRKTGEKDGLFILTDENGNKAYFDFLEMAVVDGIEYAALLQVDIDECVILQMNESNGSEEFYLIEDDCVFDKVASVFEEIFSED